MSVQVFKFVSAEVRFYVGINFPCFDFGGSSMFLPQTQTREYSEREHIITNIRT